MTAQPIHVTIRRGQQAALKVADPRAEVGARVSKVLAPSRPIHHSYKVNNVNKPRGYYLDHASNGFDITHEDGAGNGESYGFGVYNDAAEASAVLAALAARGRPVFITRRAKAAARRQGAL